jgi:hypothetical protein
LHAAQCLVPLRILPDVGLVIVEQRQLDFRIAGAAKFIWSNV